MPKQFASDDTIPPAAAMTSADGWGRWARRMHRIQAAAWTAIALLGAAVAAWMAATGRPHWWMPLLIGPCYAAGVLAARLQIRRRNALRRK